MGADIKFEVDKFIEVIKECSGVNDAVLDEFEGIGLSLKNGSLFCFQCGQEAAVMLFLMSPPFVLTDTEIERINESLELGGEGSSGKVVQLDGFGLVYFKVIENIELHITLLQSLFRRMIEGFQCINVSVNKVIG